ncbi:MAG: type II toxin-antitoxin system mRNA interferase toxin, RelE/StbE family [Patescibacteria group bacterium]
MTIRYSSKFRKSYRKLPWHLKIKAEEKEKVFRHNPFDPRMDTHKLHGKYKDYWAFTIAGSYRIMFAFSGKDTIDFINTGTHEIYR